MLAAVENPEKKVENIGICKDNRIVINMSAALVAHKGITPDVFRLQC